MTGTIKYAPGATTLRGLTPDFDYSAAIVETPTSIPATGGSQTTVQDRLMRATTTGGSDNNCIYRPQPVTLDGHDPMVTWSSLTPSVATITADGSASRVSDGLAVFEASGIYGKRQYKRQMTRSGAGAVDVFDGYVAGSLGKHIVDQMTALVAGKTPSDATRLNYSTRTGDFSSPVIARNGANFAASIDLSGMSVWRSEVNNHGYWPCALVSSRHVIAANHVAGGGLFSYAWLTPGGAIVKASVVAAKVIEGTDLQVGYLDQAMPAGVKRFKVLPANYRSYLPSAATYWIPALSKRQKVGDDMVAWIDTATYDAMRILPTRLAEVTGSDFVTRHYAEVPRIGQLDPADPLRAWQTELHTGDSGGPHFLVINGEAVLLGHYADVAGCPHIADYATQIEAAMNAMAVAAGDATSYSLSRVSLSGFPTY